MSERRRAERLREIGELMLEVGPAGAIEVLVDRQRRSEFTEWVTVAYDVGDDGAVTIVHASGLFPTPEAALLAGERETAMARELLAPDEPCRIAVVPYFKEAPE